MAEVVNDLNLKVMEPRSYQLEILEYVTQRNAIVYLPTGSGKTYVAILALKRYSHEMQRSLDDGGKRAIFMCNTVELARQQALAVREQTNLTVGLFVGERGIDSWEAKKWDAEIYNHQVLVGTAQSFVNMLQSNYIKLSQLSIVIIDECHNGTKNHPMHEFMAIFKRYPTSQHPRVVGLTGVLLKSNKLKTVNEELKTLEATYRGNIVTVRTMEAFENVMIYSTKPKENLITYNDMKSTFSVETRVKQIVDNCKKCIDAWNLGTILPKYTKSLMQLREPNKKNVVKNSLNDFLYQVEDLGVYAASFAILNCIVEFEIKQRQAETIALRQMYRYVVSCCEQIRHLLIRKLLDLCDDEESNAQLSSADNKQLHSENTILNFSTPKLVALLNRIRTVFKGRAFQDISALVFVERRSSAKCLYNVILMWINAVPELRDVLRPSFMVGRNATFVASIENALERKWTLKAIEEFRQGICNMIVTSSVLEEGIDVQACNFVIAFDKLKTFSSYVQTKGRARQTNSQYDIFSSHINQHTTLRQIKEYQEVHNAIREYLMRRLIQTNGPEQRDIDSEFRDIIPPYTIASGAFLNATSSVQMLHRYCQMLPIDSYGAVNADFKITITSDGKYVVSVRLPLQSPVRDIINGDPMSTPKAAKASAALKACARLHQNGELNEKLLPVSKMECVKKVSDQFFSLWKKYDVDTTVNKKKLGFNHQRDYKKLYPNEFINSMPEVGKKCYAYEINMKAGFECNNYTEHLYNLLQQQQNRNYAILLNKPLPALAEMQLFMNQGKVLVRISAQPIEMIIENDVKLQQLVTYHTMIFREILNLWQNRDFLVIDRRNQENSLLVVPLQNQQIDWQLVTQFQHLNGMRAYSPQERSQMIYRPEDYEGSVISKWYVGNQDQRFIVTRVCHELTTESDCDIAQYKSYKHFFESKYGNEIGRVVQPQQFLIEVRELTSRRNFFVNAKSKVNVLRDTSIIRLIPELCHNFLYPGVMWMKALLLPAILHRTHYMLQAEYIRKSINSYLGFANNPNFVNYKPQALIVDQSLKRAVDNDGNAEVMIEEKKITLNPLPAKTATTGYQITSLSNSSDWKEYLEPINVKNETMNIYGVDVNYYYKFISGLALEFDKLNLDEEDLWEKTQFEMPNYVEQCELPSNGAPALAMLNDVPLAEKRRINILERTLGRQPMKSAEQHEFLAALTTSSASDMFDMERFEVLGDAFLKFSVSIYLINKFPTWNEGYLTAVKGQLVSNRNLLYCMSEKDFAQRMYNQIFRPNFEWLPPLVSIPANILQLIAEQPELMREADASSLFSLRLTEDEVLSGKCVAENIAKFKNNCSATNTLPKSRTDDGILDYVYHQTFYDKTVADLMEALIGVCVQNYGFRHCFRLLNYFGIINEPHLDELLDKTLQTRLIRADISPREVDGFLINYPALEKNLGYTFRNRAYLLQALTHPSHPTNRLTGCYQELEFLGDAILDFFVSCYIFERNTHLTPGKLTDLRSALVNNITLGCICVRHRFHLFMLAENASLSDAVKSFAQFQETQKHCVTDQVRILMEEPVHGATDDGVLKKFNIAANVDVPKALGDIVEAIIAAVYLDSKDLETTWHVIYHLLEKELIEFSRNVPIDAVRALYEHKHAQPEFSDPVPEEDIVMVKCSFRCVDEVVNVNGFGINKEQAKKAAAKHALQILAKFSS